MTPAARPQNEENSNERPQSIHAATFKAKVTPAAIKGDKTLPARAEQFYLHPNRITQWISQLLERAMEIFATAAEKSGEAIPCAKELHTQIEQLAMENDFFGKRATIVGMLSARR